MRKMFLIPFLISFCFLFSCTQRDMEVDENVEIILKDELQSLYSEVVLAHDYYDLETDFSCKLIYKAYGIYSVDLSDAVVSVSDNVVRVTLPSAKLAYSGIKDEDFEIFEIVGDTGWTGHFSDGGELQGIEMAEEERSLVESEARELLLNDYFISKANDIAVENVTDLIRAVNKRVEGLQIFVNVEPL